MRVLGVVQARCGSTRLPNKVLADLAGEPMVARVMQRLSRATTVDEILVATSDRPADDAIAQLADARGWKTFRGSEDDVLSRFHGAAAPLHPEVVVRVTADCPLLDPSIVDRVVETLFRDGADYASNTLPPRTYPLGLDVEAFRFESLCEAHADDTDPGTREHVTPYLYRHPERFRLARVDAPKDASSHRWTVDTPEDLDLVRRIYGAFEGDPGGFTEILETMESHPEWVALNAHVEQKAVEPREAPSS